MKVELSTTDVCCGFRTSLSLRRSSWLDPAVLASTSFKLVASTAQPSHMAYWEEPGEVLPGVSPHDLEQLTGVKLFKTGDGQLRICHLGQLLPYSVVQWDRA